MQPRRSSEPADAATSAARARRNLRIAALAALALTVVMIGLATARLSLTGFVRPGRLGVATLVAVVAWGLSLLALRSTFAAVRGAAVRDAAVRGAAVRDAAARGAARSGTAARAQPLYVARSRIAIAAVFLVVAGFYLVVSSIGQAIPAALLGAHPARATALTVTRGHACLKCTVPISVSFDDRGRRVTAVLAGAPKVGAAAGFHLVYDSAHPDRVMRASDWSAGRGARGIGQLGAGVALLILVVIGVAVLGRRRGRADPPADRGPDGGPLTG